MPPRPRKRAKSPFRWLRRFLLVAGLFGIVALGIILAAYKFGQQVDAELRATPEEADLSNPDEITSGENITYVQTSGGEVVFQVEAARSIEQENGPAHLEEVALTVPRGDGEAYRIESNIARVDQEKHEARLEGDVRITGWSDLIVETRNLEVLHQGRLMISRGEVRFLYPPNLMGRASEMRIDKQNNTIVLAKGVHLHSTPESETPMRLDCQRLVFKRSEGLIRAVDRVVFRHGDQHLRAHYLSLFLREDNTLRTMQARWRIHGGMLGKDEAGGDRQLLYHGQFLEIEPSPLDPENRKVTLRGTPKEPAAMSMRLADGMARDLVGQGLEARVIGGDLSSVEATGTPLVMDEFIAMPGGKHPLRKVCARRLLAGFANGGELTQLYMEDQVELADRDIHLSGGDRAVLDLARGSLEIDGPQVTMSSDRGDLTAPKIRYARNTGLLKATGGVQTTLAENAASALAGSPLGTGDGPINVQSEEAHWTEAPPGFVFRQDVRAWRGQNLLLAEQLRGDEASGEMAASGSVTTIWRPERTTPVGPGDDPSVQEPIEVTASTVSFRRAENRLIYAGGVRLLQAGRRLTCNELAVEIEGQTGGAKHMQCRGDVELVDPTGGKTVTGESAEYRVAAAKIEVLGKPVRLIDADRNELEGGYLRYDLESGETRLSSRPPRADATGSP
ncbi:MAG: LPS export ABC transporter periplasmic protein LptC [Acidobacteriota bacterium]